VTKRVMRDIVALRMAEILRRCAALPSSLRRDYLTGSPDVKKLERRRWS